MPSSSDHPQAMLIHLQAMRVSGMARAKDLQQSVGLRERLICVAWASCPDLTSDRPLATCSQTGLPCVDLQLAQRRPTAHLLEAAGLLTKEALSSLFVITRLVGVFDT